MFNLNENNQFFISNAPTDMRVGVNAMCNKVRQAGGGGGKKIGIKKKKYMLAQL